MDDDKGGSSGSLRPWSGR